MEPGPDYDVWIAKNVMGWEVLTPAQTSTIEDVNDRVCCLQPHPGLGLMRYFDGPHMWELRRWHPSTDIVAAWDIIDRFRAPELWQNSIGFRNQLRLLEPEKYTASEMAYRICEIARDSMEPIPSWEDIRKEFGHHFDGLDVDAFMRDIRGYDEDEEGD